MFFIGMRLQAQCNSVVIMYFSFSACGLGGVDLTFVVDASAATGQSNFQLFRDFIGQVASEVNIGPRSSQVAVISFNDSPVLRFNLNAYTDRTSLNQAIGALPYSGGGTDIAEALNFLRTISQNGTLLSNPNNRQVAIFMTNGQSDAQQIAAASTALHAANIFQVYAIGVSGADMTQLNTIAGGDSDFVFYSDTFNSTLLSRIEAEVIRELCTGIQYKCTVYVKSICLYIPADIYFKL